MEILLGIIAASLLTLVVIAIRFVKEFIFMSNFVFHETLPILQMLQPCENCQHEE